MRDKKKKNISYPEVSKKLGPKYGKMHKGNEDYKEKELGARGYAVPVPGVKKSVNDKDKADAVKKKFKVSKVEDPKMAARKKSAAVLRKMQASKGKK